MSEAGAIIAIGALRIATVVIAALIGYSINKSRLQSWRLYVGFLIGLAVSLIAAGVAWTYVSTQYDFSIEYYPKAMVTSVLEALFGAYLGVYFGRKAARKLVLEQSIPLEDEDYLTNEKSKLANTTRAENALFIKGFVIICLAGLVFAAYYHEPEKKPVAQVSTEGIGVDAADEKMSSAAYADNCDEYLGYSDQERSIAALDVITNAEPARALTIAILLDKACLGELPEFTRAEANEDAGVFLQHLLSKQEYSSLNVSVDSPSGGDRVSDDDRPSGSEDIDYNDPVSLQAAFVDPFRPSESEEKDIDYNDPVAVQALLDKPYVSPFGPSGSEEKQKTQRKIVWKNDSLDPADHGPLWSKPPVMDYDSCRWRAAKMPTDSGVRAALDVCGRKYPLP
tara:strand:- start:104 stop:1288 length:1185 start_codon:yes stop_codon:yes gene_type:complete